MMRSLYSAVSGLKTHQTRMDVIGNNIANVNTEAFKSSRVTFTEIMYQTTASASGGNAATGIGGVNAKQIGLGVSTGATSIAITTAGAAETTGNPFDLKLTDSQSTNFFIVSDGTSNFFTRSGSYYVDGNGFLCMTSTGYTLMGWQIDPATGEIKKDTVSALQVMSAQNQTSAPEATTLAAASGILDKNDSNVTSEDGYAMSLGFYDDLGYSYTAKFSIRPLNTGNEAYDKGKYTVEVASILDSNGVDYVENYNTMANASNGQTIALNQLICQYQKDADGNIYGKALNANGEPAGPDVILVRTDAGDWMVRDSGAPAKPNLVPFNADDKCVLEFDTNDGKFVSVGGYAANGTLANESVVLNMESFLSAVGINATGSNFKDIEIDFSACKNLNNGGTSTMGVLKGIDGDGVGKKLGALTGLSVDSTGRIFGTYDNGNTVLLSQIAVAQFSNASGLEKIGSNCYQTTLNSGDFDGIGIEVSADGSSISTGELEMSNVDLSAQFTDMIITQRGFQANSRVITTSDTLLEELINLKR